MNTNTAITQQLIRTARTLDAERWQVCGEAWVRGPAGFHHVTVRSRLARVLNHMNRLFSYFSTFFFTGHSKPRIRGPPVCVCVAKAVQASSQCSNLSVSKVNYLYQKYL